MKIHYTFLSLGCALLGAASGYGQVRCEAGLQLGLNAGTAGYGFGEQRHYNTKLAWHGQAGAAVSLGWGHWGLQAAGLFAQKGFRVDDDYTPADFSNTNLRFSQTRRAFRLDFLTVPVNLVYHQHADGQGLQVFGGGYVARLLGGRYRYNDMHRLILNDELKEISGSGDGNIEVANTFDTSRGLNRTVLRPWDVGVQAGLGYRYQRLLVQLGYTRSLRDLSPDYSDLGRNVPLVGPSYKLRGLQLTGTYLLFGSKP